MTTLLLRLDPTQLNNPDLDLRYRLPDLLAERTGGDVAYDGYDYAEHPARTHYLVLFLKTSDLDVALPVVLDVIENVRLMGNDLRPAVVVAVERNGRRAVVYPTGFSGEFLPITDP